MIKNDASSFIFVSNDVYKIDKIFIYLTILLSVKIDDIFSTCSYAQTANEFFDVHIKPSNKETNYHVRHCMWHNEKVTELYARSIYIYIHTHLSAGKMEKLTLCSFNVIDKKNYINNCIKEKK